MGGTSSGLSERLFPPKVRNFTWFTSRVYEVRVKGVTSSGEIWSIVTHVGDVVRPRGVLSRSCSQPADDRLVTYVIRLVEGVRTILQGMG